VDTKAECGQLKLAHVVRNKKSINKKLKQTIGHHHLMCHRFITRRCTMHSIVS